MISRRSLFGLGGVAATAAIPIPAQPTKYSGYDLLPPVPFRVRRVPVKDLSGGALTIGAPGQVLTAGVLEYWDAESLSYKAVPVLY
jgi:hypothetical protein